MFCLTTYDRHRRARECGGREGEREGGGGGKEKGESKRLRRGGEHGRLRNDFNESTESPADTLDMTPGD